jgi:hypothetical protein
MMQTQEIEVDGNHKPFIQKLGKTLIFLSSFYWIEVTILGPQFDLIPSSVEPKFTPSLVG